jgi:polysaccharide biosynthesis transport protein
MDRMGTIRRDAKANTSFSGLEYYGIAEYRKLFSRRKWFMASIALLSGVIVALGAMRIPNQYQASTVILVDPEKVPESYVRSTATIDAAQRLAILEEQILSATRLGQVIDELGLYQSLKAKLTREDIVGLMQKDIKVEPATIGAQTKELRAFKVSFTSRSSVLAAKVSNRLASLFIEENMQVREQQVLGTADFFQRELEKAKDDLAEKSRTLSELKKKYVAVLPATQNLQLQELTTAQLELRSEMDAESRAEEQRNSLRAILAENPAVVNLDTNQAGSDSGLEEERQRLQGEMDQLRTRYGPDYPDVLSKAAEIQKIQDQINDAEKSKSQGQGPPAIGGRRHNPVVESQLAQLNDEVQRHQARERELKDQVAFFQSKLQGAPEAEQELEAATNDFASAEERYKRLEDHKFTADMSSEVETRQKGERFVILEPAQPPDRPDSPNRLLIDLGGLAAGLGLAIFLVIGREFLNPAIKVKQEIHDRFPAQVFGEVPWLATSYSRTRGRIWSVLAATFVVALALGYAGLLRVALQ